MNLIGDPIGADEAFEFGLVNRVVADHELLDTALAWARKLAGQAPLARRRRSRRSPARATSTRASRPRRTASPRRSRSEDAREGIGAFLGKRTPQWKGE